MEFQEQMVHVHFNRLKNAFQKAQITYYIEPLLDLSASLRTWYEMRNSLYKINSKFENLKIFKGIVPSKALFRNIKAYDFIITYFSENVITFSHNGEIASGPSELFTNSKNIFMDCKSMPLENNGLKISHFCIVKKVFTQKDSHLIKKGLKKKYILKDWFDAEIIRYRLGDEIAKLSRSELIEVMANNFDGVHSSLLSRDKFVDKNKEIIEYFMKFSILGLPMPYYLLFSIADELLDKVSSIMTE